MYETVFLDILDIVIIPDFGKIPDGRIGVADKVGEAEWLFFHCKHTETGSVPPFRVNWLLFPRHGCMAAFNQTYYT